MNTYFHDGHNQALSDTALNMQVLEESKQTPETPPAGNCEAD